MISWIQERLVRQGKWIFSILLVVIVISFVFTIGNVQGLPGRDASTIEADFFGVNLNDSAEVERLQEDTMLSAQLQGNRIFSEQQLTQLAYYRAAALAIAEEINLPEPTEVEMREFIAGLAFFQLPQGEGFDRDEWVQFLDSLQANPRLSQARLQQVLTDQYRIDQLMQALEGPGFVLPHEAELRAARNTTQWTLATAMLSTTDFDLAIEMTDEELQTYFNANQTSYQLPERRQISFAHFPAEDFRPEPETVETAVLKEYFEANRVDFIDEADASVEATLGLDRFESVRDEVLAAYLDQTATERARAAAISVFDLLVDEPVELNSEGFEAKIDTVEARRGELPLVSSESSPRTLGVSQSILREILSLHDDIYFTSVHPFREGYALFFLEDTLPSTIPPLGEVRARVASDFREARQRQLFSERGRELREEIAQALENGSSFEDAVAGSAIGMGPEEQMERLRQIWRGGAPFSSIINARISPIQTYESFNVASVPRELPRPVFQATESLGEGGLSPMISTDGRSGYIAFVVEKETPEVAAGSDAYTVALGQLRPSAAATAAFSLVAERVTEELIAAGVME